jgi:hypothetical protein
MENTKENIFKLILENSTYKIDEQFEFDNNYVQTIVNFETFGESWSINFQPTDMNGDGPISWKNDGANSGIDDFYYILCERKEFENFSELELDEFIDKFIRYFLDLNEDIELNLYEAEEELEQKRLLEEEYL